MCIHDDDDDEYVAEQTDVDKWSVFCATTFTPAILYTVGAIGQKLLNWPIKQLKVTFCFPVPPHCPNHLFHLFLLQSLSPHKATDGWERKRILRFCDRSASISSSLVFLSSVIDTTYKNVLSLPELQTPPPLFYFSTTCFHWGLITWWTE